MNNQTKTPSWVTAYDNPASEHLLNTCVAETKNAFLDMAQVCLDQGGLPLAVQRRIAAIIDAYREVASGAE
jgi:hypothetical protein